jgi:hypothetical protein
MKTTDRQGPPVSGSECAHAMWAGRGSGAGQLMGRGPSGKGWGARATRGTWAGAALALGWSLMQALWPKRERKAHA